MTLNTSNPRTVLLVGASRGLGLAMAVEFARRDWNVVATVREGSGTGLHALPQDGRITIEHLDITVPGSVAALRGRLAPDSLDMLFVNAGTANRDQAETIAEVSDEEFVRVMLVNALGVMRTVEALHDTVRPDGVVGVMSSGQGSISNNTRGGHEIYRGSKAALNQYMRSFAARHAADPRALVLLAPGWIRTELGGPDAPYGIEDTVPQIVETLIAQRGTPSLRFVDRFNDTVPW